MRFDINCCAHYLSPLIMNRLTSSASSALRTTSARRSTSILAQRGYAQHKQVLFSNEGRAAMLKGVDILARAVSVTLGPKGGCGGVQSKGTTRLIAGLQAGM